MRSVAFDQVMTFEIIRRLSQSWDQTPAFSRGIIDARGNVLRPFKTLTDMDDKPAYTTLDRAVFSMKRVIEALPGGRSRIATIAAALWLLREPKSVAPVTVESLESIYPLAESFMKQHKLLSEDAPANAVGNGGIAGAGVGPQGEPGGGRTKFANNDVFSVSSDRYHKCVEGKRRYLKYENYVGTDDVGQTIREFARKNPNKPIIIQDQITGSMSYLRYGSTNPARKLGIHEY